MLFTDDESRHEFHQAPLLLQVVCEILETDLAQYRAQVELIDCDNDEGIWMAVLALREHLEPEALRASVARCNRAFMRKDGNDTCVIENVDVGLISVRVTQAIHFSASN